MARRPRRNPAGLQLVTAAVVLTLVPGDTVVGQLSRRRGLLRVPGVVSQQHERAVGTACRLQAEAIAGGTTSAT